MLRGNIFSSAVLAVFLFFLSLASVMASPNLINYQGYLQDNAGSPVSGDLAMEFRLMDADAGGNMVWGETYPAVTVANGIYHVLLGSGTRIDPSPDLDASIFANPDLWLEVTVSGEIQAPRQKLTSVPYAMRAEKVTDPSPPKTLTGFEYKTSIQPGYSAVGFTIDTSAYLVGGVNSAQYIWDSFQEEFIEFSVPVIPTASNEYDWQVFTMGVDTYIVVADWNNKISVYRWDGTQGIFVYFWEQGKAAVRSVEPFVMGSSYYIAASDEFGNNYVHDATTGEITHAIPGTGTYHLEPFSIGADTYIAAANRSDGGNFNINSLIFQINEQGGVVAIQLIPTHGATDIEAFNIGSDTYLAVANSYNGSSYNIDSVIYKWDGNAFVQHQNITTSGALDWQFFSVGDSNFLAVANRQDGASMNIDSVIYKWNGTIFEEFQRIPTNGAFDWSVFVIGTDAYLVVSNSTGNTNIYKSAFSGVWAQGTENVLFLGGNIGVGTSQPNSPLEVNGYLKIGTTNATPPAADCDAATERGRMMINTAGGVLYVCADSGWVAK